MAKGLCCRHVYLYCSNLLYQYILIISQIYVKACDDSSERNGVPLVTELAYVISRLHSDTFPEIAILHEVGFMVKHGPHIESTLHTVSFEECVKAEMNNETHITIGNKKFKITEILSGISGGARISDSALTTEKKLGEVPPLSPLHCHFLHFLHFSHLHTIGWIWGGVSCGFGAI